VSSLIVGVGFVFIDVLGSRWYRLGGVLLVLFGFLVLACFKAWRDERRARIAQPIEALLAESNALDEEAEKMLRNWNKGDIADFLDDKWLTQNLDYDEIRGRPLRTRTRIFVSNLQKAGVDLEGDQDRLTLYGFRPALEKNRKKLQQKIDEIYGKSQNR
jgi:hypothetical protein